MSQAEIGNLRVRLGIDSAEFTAGAKAVQSQLGTLAAGFKGFAVGVLGALSFGAAVSSIQSSIDHMDELGKAAQKIGIPVAELSKLEYAAKLSDVSLEELTGSVAKFSRQLAQIAGGGQNDAGKALKALGVSAVDAQGQLRPTIDIMKDVADKFAAMRDGAGKTAISMALFGKSGAQLIPLMNGGAQAINEAGDQLERFGSVISEDASRNAEHFNDNVTKLQQAGKGLSDQLAQAMLPALVNVSDALVTFAEKGGLAQQIAASFSEALRTVSEFAATTYKEIYAIGQVFGALGATASDPANFQAAWDTAFENIRVQAAETAKQIQQIRGDSLSGSSDSIDRLVASWNGTGGQAQTDPPIVQTIKKVKAGSDEAAKALANLKDEGTSVWESTRTPIENYQLEIRHLNELLAAGSIDHETYGRAVKQLQDEFSNTAPAVSELSDSFKSLGDSIAGSIGSALTDVISGTASVKDAFADMARSIAQMLSQLAAQLIQSSIIKLLGSFVGGGVGGGFGGFYAEGGKLGAGKWGIAGENGPEVIHGPANITPMQSGGAAAAQPRMLVNVNNYSSAVPSVRERPDGGVDIDMVERQLATRVARGGSPLSSGIEKAFGVKRAGR